MFVLALYVSCSSRSLPDPAGEGLLVVVVVVVVGKDKSGS